MYRQHEKEMSMEAEANEDQRFISRCVSYPVVATAIGQVTNLYGRTKESNRLVKYTLETAESGVKVAANTAAPVINKFEKPISGLDNYACAGLDKLENYCPTLKKPTEEVIQDSKDLYNKNVKPTVDRITGVYTYGKDTVEGVKNYSFEKVDAVKTFSKNQIDNVVHYGVSTVNGAAQGVKRNVDSALQTTYGKKVLDGVHVVLDKAEDYVEKYLPDQEENEKDKEGPMEIDCIENEPTTMTFNKVTTLSSKMKRRMYNRAMKDMQNIQLRSQETIKKLNFTVDLMEYARDYIDSTKSTVGNGIQATKDRLNFYWEEINRTEEELEMDDLTKDNEYNTDEEDEDGEVDVPSPAKVTPTMLEKKALSTARHLSIQLKGTMSTVSEKTKNALPDSVKQRLSDAMIYSEDLYNQLTKMKNVQDLPQQMMNQARDKLSYIQDTMVYLVQNYNPIGWLSGLPDDPQQDMSWEDDDESPSNPEQPGYQGYTPVKPTSE